MGTSDVFFTETEFYKTIDRECEEQWSSAKCKWFFGKLRKKRLWNKIMESHLTISFYGPIEIIIPMDKEN